MKKFALALSLVFTVYTTIFAQPSLQWASTFNGPIANDEGKTIAIDANSNVYVAGSSDGVSGASDFLVLKYNSEGSLLWSQRYNGTTNGQDSARAIRVDALGNVFITGKSQGSGNNINIVTIKYDQTGVQKWASVYSGTAVDNGGYSLEVDVFGNVYVIGAANSHNVLIKYNGSGVLQWSKNLSNSYNSQNEAFFAVSPFDGHLIIADGGSLTAQYNVWKLHPSTGNVVQTYNTGFTGGNVIYGIPNSMVLDATGNIYVTSMSDPDLYTDKPNRIHTAKFTQGSDSYAWYHYTYVTGSIQTLSCVDMKIDNNANLYILGKWYNGSEYIFFTKMLTSAGSQVWSKPSNFSEGIRGTPVSLSLGKLSTPPDIYETGFTSIGDIKIIKFDNNGDTLWTKVYDCGNNGVDIASKMAIDACDNIYIAGSSNCNGTYKDVKTIKYGNITPTISASGPTTFCQGDSVILTSSSANGYQWSNGATTQSITVSASGMYSVTITNASQCTAASIGITVLVNPIPTVMVNSPIICSGQPATLTATGATTYLWSNGVMANSINVSPAATTTFTVTGTTAGCSSIPAPAQVIVNPLPTVTVNSPTICMGQSATLTAAGATTYLWSNGETTNSITVSPTVTTTFTLTGTTAGCLSIPAPAQVTVNSLPIITVNSPTICMGQSATLTAAGATTYLWSNGETTNSITVSPTESTTLTVIGTMAGCSSAPVAAQVTVNILPIVTVNSPTICAGRSATLTANGAATYLWSTGATTNTITVTPNSSSTYTVTGTTANCASVPASAAVTVNPLPNVTVNSPTICAGQPATLTANGAMTYQWSTGAIINPITVSPSSSTTYTVIGVSDVQCSASATAQVSVDPLLTPSLTIGGSTVLCLGQNATFIAMPTNGGPTPTFQWFLNNIQVGTGSTYSTMALTNGAQIYCSMMSDATCASPTTATSSTITVTVIALPNVQITHVGPTTFCLGSSVTLTANPTGSYLWSTGAVTKNITVSTAGTYTVAVTTSNGCSAISAPTIVSVNPLPQTPMIFPPGPVILCQGEEVTLTSSFENSWLWNTGATDQSINVSTAGSYSLVVTNANMCSATSSPVVVTVSPIVQPAISLSVTCSGNDANVTSTATNGGANPVFQWWLNDVIQTAFSGPVLPVLNGQNTWIVKCQMTSNANCASPAMSQQKEIALTCIVGAKEVPSPEGFNVFPNPSTGAFTIEYFLPEAIMVEQRVLNVLGQTLWRIEPKLEEGKYHRKIDLGKAVVPGIYLLETRLDGRAFLRKIEVQ